MEVFKLWWTCQDTSLPQPILKLGRNHSKSTSTERENCNAQKDAKDWDKRRLGVNQTIHLSNFKALFNQSASTHTHKDTERQTDMQTRHRYSNVDDNMTQRVTVGAR